MTNNITEGLTSDRLLRITVPSSEDIKAMRIIKAITAILYMALEVMMSVNKENIDPTSALDAKPNL